MTPIQEQVSKARAAGYTDAEITAHLSDKPEFSDKIRAARSSGYSDQEIGSYLFGAPSGKQAAPEAKQPAVPAKSKPIHEQLLDVVTPSEKNKKFFANKANLGLTQMADFPLAIVDAVSNPRKWADAIANLGSVVSPTVGGLVRGLAQNAPDVSLAGRAVGAVTGTPGDAGVASLIHKPAQELLGADPRMRADGFIPQVLGNAIEMGVSGAPFGVLGIARAPYKGLALGAEVGSSAGGGVGREVGGMVSEGLGYGRDAGEAIGGLAGGIQGGLAATAASKLYAARNNLQLAQDRIVSSRAGQEVAKAIDMTPGAREELVRSMDTAKRVSELAGRPFKPNLAQATGAVGADDLQRRVFTKDIESHSSAIEQQRGAEATLARAKERAFPQGSSPVSSATNKLRQDMQRIENSLEAIEAQKRQLGSLGADANLEIAGANLRILRDEAYQSARGTKNSMYQRAYDIADQQKIAVKIDDVAEEVAKIKAADENAFQSLPSALKKVHARYAVQDAEQTGRYVPPDLMKAAQEARGTKSDISFRELHSAIRETNRQLYNATDDTQRYLLGQLKTKLAGKVEELKAPEFGGAGQAIKDADDFYRNTYRRAFREGVGGMLDPTAAGKFGDRIADSRIVNRLLTPEGMEDFRAVYGNNPQAMQTLKDGVLGLFMRQHTADGLIKKGGVDAFIRQHKDSISKIPGMEATLRNTDEMGKALLLRENNLRLAQKALDDGVLARVSRADNLDDVAKMALNDEKALRRLAFLAGNKDQRAGLMRAIADRIPAEAQTKRMTPLQYVMENESALRPVLDSMGPDHFKNLKTLMAGETMLARSTVPEHANISGMGQTAIEGVTGSTPRTIWSQANAVTQGRQGIGAAVSHLLTRFRIKVNAENIAKVQDELVRNPELVRAMLKNQNDAKFNPTKFGKDVLSGGNSTQDMMLRAFIRTMNTMPDEAPQ